MRVQKALHRQRKHVRPVIIEQVPRRRRFQLDVGCVIHGTAYDWVYVDRLRSMVQRNVSIPVQFHVWTEHDRSVPPTIIKHCLEEWPGITGPKKSWWYKLQMFNSKHFAGDLLYFDLDTVICNDISWILNNSTERFWTIRDFRYLQNKNYNRMNSSIMWWNTTEFDWVWQKFQQLTPGVAARRYHGDQDFLQETIALDQRRFLPDECIQSWRWSAWEGGMNFGTRRTLNPGSGAQINPTTSVLVFHGHPKPHEIKSSLINQFWY